MKRALLLCFGLMILGGESVQAQGVISLVVTEFMASNTSILADGNGEFSDWIEIYNPTASAISVSGCYLSDDPANLTKWVFPAAAAKTVPANGYLVVFASGNASGTTPYVDSKGYIHTSFKLSATGESVLLVNTDGATIISSYTAYPEQGQDISYGLGSNAVTGFLRTPTPGAANGTATLEAWVADTHFDIKRGFYSSPFAVTITCATTGATIKYTLDCSTPTESNGTTYTGPIPVSGTTVIRAFAYKTGLLSTDVDTQTYIFLANTISQPATKPNSLWPDPYTPTGGPGGGGGATKQAMDYGMDSKVTGDSRYSTLIDDALLAIPTIAITTDLPNLFNSSTGIYANPTMEGDSWERPACVELINPDGSEGFHVNTGLRIRGGTTAGKSNPKHSFRIVMRSDYGDEKIEYPLFGPDGPKKFDKLDFRTAQNFSWNNSSPQYCTHLDDPFTRDTMLDMGQMSTRGFFFHLYLDGVYWGVYNTEERAEAYYAQSYLGGSADDYDALKADDNTGAMTPTDGTTALYYAFWTQVNAGVSTVASYFTLMGQNADGTVNTGYTKYLDVDNLIDYMLVVFFTGAQDMPLGPPNQNSKPRNLIAVGNRVAPDGFKFIVHDNEWSLLQQSGVNINKVSVTLGSALGTQANFNPWWLHSKLKGNAEYVLHFADHVHKHFFNGGALTPAACTARLQERIDELSMAIIAESARWGDYLSSTDARTKDDDWLPAVNWIKNSFFNASPQTRTAIVLSQLQSAGLYPTVAAPEYSQHGGTVSAGFPITITAAAGTIYYTIDGNDPRQIGGSPGATASTGSSGMTMTIPSTRTVKARAYSGGTWSALTEATFTVPGSSSVGDWWMY